MLLRSALVALFYATLAVMTMASAASDTGEHKYIEGAVQPKPAYVSGRPVLYFSVSKYALANAGAALAYSVYNSQGEPVIFYDEETLATLPQAFQLWVFEHELEHFNLGHFDILNSLYQKSMGFKGVQYSFEQAADCAAVKMLQHKYSMTRDEIVLVAQTAQEVFQDSPLRRTSRSIANYSHQFD